MHVTGDDPQLVIGRPGHGGALRHFHPQGDRPFKGFEILFGGKRELDRTIDLEGEAEFLPVQDRHPALDDSVFLQALDAPPAGARGKAHALGDLGHRQAGVMLNQIEDAGADGVQGFRQILPSIAAFRDILIEDKALLGVSSASLSQEPI